MNHLTDVAAPTRREPSDAPKERISVLDASVVGHRRRTLGAPRCRSESGCSLSDIGDAVLTDNCAGAWCSVAVTVTANDGPMPLDEPRSREEGPMSHQFPEAGIYA